jgi:hypothetical protein
VFAFVVDMLFMRGQGKYIVGALAIAAFCPSTNRLGAAASADYYKQIPTRNLFGLHDQVVVVQPPIPPALPKVVLSGITTMGNKLAFLKVQSPPPKPGEQQQAEQSFMLMEGQREGDIEILEIDEKAGTVRVNNSGTEMTIGFDKDAAKVAKSPPSAQPGIPNIPGAGRGMNPGVSGYQRMIPTRTGRQVPAGPEPPLPPSTTPTGQPLIQPQNAPTEKPLTPEEQAILKELEQAAQSGSGQPR